MAFEGIRGDYAVYVDDERASLLQPGFWVAVTHRIGAAARAMPNRPLKYAVLALHGLLAAPWRVLNGVHIPSSTKIGPGLRLPHPREIILSPDAEFGTDCSIYQNVTVGGGAAAGVPRFGDRVMLFPGARVMGGVSVGDDAHIGANAVVTTDVPAGAVVSAPASRVIPRETLERMSGGRRSE